MKLHPVVLLLRLLAFSLLLAASLQASAKELWSYKLPDDAKWHQLTELGTLLVGTNDALVCIDPETGKLLWKNEAFKKSSPYNVREVAGTPILVANNQHGMGGAKTELVAIDFLTGKELWKSQEYSGQYIGTLPMLEQGLVLMIFTGWDEQNGKGICIHAFDLATGQKKWIASYGKANAIQLHVADNSSTFAARLDLSGHQDPVREGDRLYLPYLGLHCLDLKTGQFVWQMPFKVADPVNKKAYPALRIEGDVIYAGGAGEIYAVNKNTGALVWKSEHVSQSGLKVWKNAVLSQIEVVGDRIFVRMGGNYSDGKQVVLKKPLGVLALDKASGKELWRSKDIDNGITNLLPLPALGVVVCADGDSLVGIDSVAPAYTEKFHAKIAFKRKMGGGDAAQLGLGVLGGVSGILKASSSQSKARLDVPVAVIPVGDKLIVRGKQHLFAFDPKTGTETWSLYYAAPGQGGFGMAALFAVTALAAAQGNVTAAQGGFGSSGYDSGVGQIHSALDNYNRVTGQRKSATQDSARYTYVLTKVSEGKEIGIVGINLATGHADRELALKTKEPDYEADENAGRIFFFKGKDTVVAYQF